MWESATSPLVTGILPHLTHNFFGETFPVEDEIVEAGRIGILVGNFHTPKVFEPHSIPNIRGDDAPEADSARAPIAWGVGMYTPDFNFFTRPGLCFIHARTSHSP